MKLSLLWVFSEEFNWISWFFNWVSLFSFNCSTNNEIALDQILPANQRETEENDEESEEEEENKLVEISTIWYKIAK